MPMPCICGHAAEQHTPACTDIAVDDDGKDMRCECDEYEEDDLEDEEDTD